MHYVGDEAYFQSWGEDQSEDVWPDEPDRSYAWDDEEDPSTILSAEELHLVEEGLPSGRYQAAFLCGCPGRR